MKQIVVYNPNGNCDHQRVIDAGEFDFWGLPKPIPIALIERQLIVFNSDSPENDFNVLLKVIAVSSNYRDKYLIYRYQQIVEEGTQNFLPFGSEFVAQVVAVGSRVENLRVGDRVIPNCSYPSKKDGELLEGIPSNQSFSELIILNSFNVIKIPESMPDEMAAGFSINFFTAYSIARRLSLRSAGKKRILIVGVKSNVSLSLLALLRDSELSVWGTSSTYIGVDSLRKMGLERLIITPQGGLQDVVGKVLSMNDLRESGGFDFIFDPFADVNLSACISLLARNGKYATCGISDQTFDSRVEVSTSSLASMIVKNAELIFNCLGGDVDIQDAMADFNNGSLHFPVCKYNINQYRQFIHISYCEKSKPVGKQILFF